MANVKPKRYVKPVSMRVDPEFLAAIGEVMRADKSQERPPPMSAIIRRLVLAERDRLRREKRK